MTEYPLFRVLFFYFYREEAIHVKGDKKRINHKRKHNNERFSKYELEHLMGMFDQVLIRHKGAFHRK